MKKFTELMHNVSGALMLIGQTLISAFFVIVILVLVLVVEIQRVAHGIQLFEQASNLAYFGAFVLVMMLLTLEFVIHYVESKSGFHQEQKTKFSLKVAAGSLKYFLGYDNGWKPRYKSPAHEIKSYSRLLTMTILALALGGSMTDALSSVSGSWIQGLQTIALESSILEIVEWSGGLLFALALVIGAQRLTAYVAARAAETLQSSEPQSPQKNESVYPVTVNLPEIDQKPLPHIGYENLDHIAICDDCGWQSSPKDSEVNASRALSMHRRSCEACNETVQS